MNRGAPVRPVRRKGGEASVRTERRPKLTLREVVLGAPAITFASGIVGMGVLLYLSVWAGFDGVFSLRLGGVAAVSVVIGLVFLLVQYYGDRRFWQ